MKIWDIILGVLSILSIILALVSEEYRVLAIIFAFVLLIILLLSVFLMEIYSIKENQYRISEKLKIHEQLIDIKAEMKSLQEEVARNG